MFKYFIVVLLFSSCGAVSSSQRPSTYYDNQPSHSDTSLFNENAEFSDTEIKKILSFKLSLPDQSRIAVLDISTNNRWNGPQTMMSDDIVSGLFNRLQQSKRVYDASALPTLLVPVKRNIENLRGAAARYQADLLLVYQSRCQTFQDYNVFDPNLTKAYCTIESLVIDTRSGIVPFTFLATNKFEVEEKDKDTNFRETILKGEMKAIAMGLEQVGEKLAAFVESIPVRPASASRVHGVEKKVKKPVVFVYMIRDGVVLLDGVAQPRKSRQKIPVAAGRHTFQIQYENGEVSETKIIRARKGSKIKLFFRNEKSAKAP